MKAWWNRTSTVLMITAKSDTDESSSLFTTDPTFRTNRENCHFEDESTTIWIIHADVLTSRSLEAYTGFSKNDIVLVQLSDMTWTCLRKVFYNPWEARYLKPTCTVYLSAYSLHNIYGVGLNITFTTLAYILDGW